MDWLILIFLVPLILVPIVLLCGFAGCGLDVVGTAILPPSNLSATAGGPDHVNLSWQNNAGAGVVFFVDRGPPGGSLLPVASNVSATTFTNSGLPEGTTFLYQVRSVPASTYPSGPSNVVAVTTFPATPTGLVATSIDASHDQLSWTNASTSALAKKFSLEHRSSPGSGWTEIYKGSATTFSPAGITPGGNDEFRVTAIVDGYDNNVAKEVSSNPSAPISGITQIPITPPGLTWKTAYNVPLTTDDPGWENYTIVQRIDAAHITNAGTKVRLTLRGSTVANLVINKVTISQPATAGHAWDSTAPLVQVLFGGVSGVTIPANTAKISDDTNYNLDLGKDLIVAFDISAAAGSARRATLPGPTEYYKQATAEATVPIRSANYLTHAGRTYIIEKIEVA